MGRVKQPLKVVPNPYGAIDHNAQPCCAVLMEQGGHVPAGTMRYVGASIVHAEEIQKAQIVKIGTREVVMAAGDHDIVWEFDPEPCDVPSEGDVGLYYIRHIQDGSLVAADKRTALLAGISNFKEPGPFLEAAKDAARKVWDEQHGEGDFDAAQKEREAATQARAEAKAAAKPTTKPVAPPVTEEPTTPSTPLAKKAAAALAASATSAPTASEGTK